MMMNFSKWTKPVDFFATRSHYVDHLAPVYLALDETIRGEFYVPMALVAHAEALGVDAVGLKAPGVNNPLQVAPLGNGPLCVASYADLQKAAGLNSRRAIIYFEHGVGLTFPHSAYAGGRGMKRFVSLFLDPNKHVRALNAKAHPDKAGVVVGTPKLDHFFTTKGTKGHEGKPVVCISFHWDGGAVAPEAGNAFGHYKSVLAKLARQDDFTLIGHAHPRIMDVMEKFYQSIGVEVVRDFNEVMRRADVYVNDCSSTLYEFCVTGKRVVVLNAPHFRKHVHLGLRFWDFVDVGPQVEKAEDLLGVVRSQVEGQMSGQKDPFKARREEAVAALYPFRGEAAARAAKSIEDFMASKVPPVKRVTEMNGESVGILYMAFGKKAAAEVRKSMLSLRNTGVVYPVCVVGDTPVQGAHFIEWTGQSPFDATCRDNFQFRAGRIKPFLYDLSPFERTLYIDADTEFIADISMGFQMLGEFDMALAEELLSIGQLYNKPRAGWEINIQERDATIAELGGDKDRKFLNSGVIFFRKNPRVQAVFAKWHEEWLRFQQWDEQLALMRAMHGGELKVRALGVDWNHPHRNKAGIIFHNYGRGVARMNAPAPSARRMAIPSAEELGIEEQVMA